MSRMSAFKSLTRGVLRSGQLAQGRGLMVRFLSDDSESSNDLQATHEVKSKPKRVELEKPASKTSHLFIWPDVQAKNIHHSELNKSSDDGITATWDFKNNELDVEQLAGLPSPSEVDDPYTSSGLEQESFEEAEHRQMQEELQFGRMRALREQLNQEMDSSEPFTSYERSSLASVQENVDFMMQELGQISFLLKTLYPQVAKDTSMAMGQEDYAMETGYAEPQYASWPQTLPSSDTEKQDVEASSEESQEYAASPVMTSESDVVAYEIQLRSDQEVGAPDEVMAADETPIFTPLKPAENSPHTDGRQDTEPKEPIHTYRPFKTIEVPATKPSRSLYSQANADADLTQEEIASEGRASNDQMREGYTISAQLPECESRFLMRMALKQALYDLESGETNYRATVLVATDEESHDVD